METNRPIMERWKAASRRPAILAARYRCEFVDLNDYHLEQSCSRPCPVELMFRYNFVPLEQHDGMLTIAIADPSKLMMMDEIGLLLDRRIKTKVATLAADQRHAEEDRAVAARAG